MEKNNKYKIYIILRLYYNADVGYSSYMSSPKLYLFLKII